MAATSFPTTILAATIEKIRIDLHSDLVTTGTSAIALVAGLLPAEQRAKSIGFLNIEGGLAPVLGVVVGAPAVDAVGWRPL